MFNTFITCYNSCPYNTIIYFLQSNFAILMATIGKA